MGKTITILKRDLSSEDIRLIVHLIENYGHKGRTFISKELCRIWDWRSPNGQYRDIICRDLLRRLDKRGLIILPARLRAARKPGYQNNPVLPKDFNPLPISCGVKDIANIEVFMVKGTSEEKLYNALINTFHYLGYHQGSGEQLKYLIKGDGQILAAIGFAGAAYKIAARDTYIGWDNNQREKNLVKVINNNRFLIMPWVKVAHLASYILGRVTRRLIHDWNNYYKRDIVLSETFVDKDRFKGTCYKAANWKYLGQTKGRTRNDRYSNIKASIKDIYVYPLTRYFREALTWFINTFCKKACKGE